MASPSPSPTPTTKWWDSTRGVEQGISWEGKNLPRLFPPRISKGRWQQRPGLFAGWISFLTQSAYFYMSTLCYLQVMGLRDLDHPAPENFIVGQRMGHQNGLQAVLGKQLDALGIELPFQRQSLLLD